jgi:hypothetical protein
VVTAWSPSDTLRGRPWTRPLRLAWLCALLLGLVYMHGVSTEGVAAHLSPGTPAPAASVHHDEAAVFEHEPDAHHDGHDSSHPGQECAAGQPQHGGGLAAPCPATVTWGRSFLAEAPAGVVLAGPESARPASRDATESTVLRI